MLGSRSPVSRGVVVALTLLVLLAVSSAVSVTAQRLADGQAPKFTVDPFWPKPLPNRWLLGQVAGVAVDPLDHVWIVQRPRTLTDDEKGATLTPPRNECCVPAPPVMEFDGEGNLLQAWGGPGPGYDWPANEHGIFVDSSGNVWLAGNGEKDNQILKFTRAGRFLMQIGKPASSGGDADTRNLNRPADVRVDAPANELYVADGYANHRVIVFDATTGAYKRHWTGGDTPFKGVSCVEIAKDGTVYVCDRGNNRLAAFDKTGTLLKSGIVSPSTKGTGSVWDVAFSSDPQQRFVYVADGHDQQIFILRRDTLEMVGSFGDGGRYPGTFYSVGSIAVDSKGNIYTGETLEGKRVQKFVLKGAGR